MQLAEDPGIVPASRSGTEPIADVVTRILLVDDRPENLVALSRVLRPLPVEMHEAANGHEALASVLRHRFALILLDVQMPDMDGFETARLIREYERPRRTPIIFITALSKQDHYRDRGYEAGAVDYICKPVDAEIVLAKARLFVDLYTQERAKLVAEQEMRRLEVEGAKLAAEKDASEARARLADELEKRNRELEAANHRITETQSMLVHAEKMASLGQLVAGIAHELNNPVAFITGNVYTVERGIEKIVDSFVADLGPDEARRLEKVRRRLGETRLGLERIKELVQKLRTFSRLDAGRFGDLDLGEAIETVLMILTPKLKQRIEVHRDLGFEGSLACYPGELNQVLMNVIANAADAIEAEGTIHIATSREDGHAVIRVRDSGPGISDEVRARMFDPFFTTKTVGDGTGLGLSLAYATVEAHRGRIEARNHAEGGAELEIRIPLDLDRRRET